MTERYRQFLRPFLSLSSGLADLALFLGFIPVSPLAARLMARVWSMEGKCWCGKNLCMDAQSHMKAKWGGAGEGEGLLKNSRWLYLFAKKGSFEA